jgi:hypothetical protein
VKHANRSRSPLFTVWSYTAKMATVQASEMTVTLTTLHIRTKFEFSFRVDND